MAGCTFTPLSQGSPYFGSDPTFSRSFVFLFFFLCVSLFFETYQVVRDSQGLGRARQLFIPIWRLIFLTFSSCLEFGELLYAAADHFHDFLTSMETRTSLLIPPPPIF